MILDDIQATSIRLYVSLSQMSPRVSRVVFISSRSLAQLFLQLACLSQSVLHAHPMQSDDGVNIAPGCDEFEKRFDTAWEKSRLSPFVSSHPLKTCMFRRIYLNELSYPDIRGNALVKSQVAPSVVPLDHELRLSTLLIVMQTECGHNVGPKLVEFVASRQ